MQNKITFPLEWLTEISYGAAFEFQVTVTVSKNDDRATSKQLLIMDNEKVSHL